MASAVREKRSVQRSNQRLRKSLEDAREKRLVKESKLLHAMGTQEMDHAATPNQREKTPVTSPVSPTSAVNAELLQSGVLPSSIPLKVRRDLVSLTQP